MKMAFRFCVVLLVGARVFGFSLWGPAAPWMTPEKGFDGVGGPMNIGAGYRWNVPVITYDFDDSFRNFFGERGIYAVEQAIRAVEAGFSADAATAPTDVVRMSPAAQAAGVFDLKSLTMAVLLEQAGLANALKNAYVLRNVGITTEATNYHIVQRNFDPITHAPSEFINGSQLHYGTQALPDGTFDAVEYPVDQAQAVKIGVAGSVFAPGEFAVRLSRDDVGGLRYLYATNSLRYELSAANVQAVSGALVDAAVRPGRGRIQFVRHAPAGAVATNYARTITFDDVYVQGGVTKTQAVQRVVYGPDILFKAEDVGMDSHGAAILFARMLGPWRNHSELWGAAGEGPGTIAPYGVISFSTSVASPVPGPVWGTFDAPGGFYVFDPVVQDPLPKLDMVTATMEGVTLKLAGIRRRYTIQASDDFISWTNFTTVSNATTTTIVAPIREGQPGYYRAIEGAPY